MFRLLVVCLLTFAALVAMVAIDTAAPGLTEPENDSDATAGTETKALSGRQCVVTQRVPASSATIEFTPVPASGSTAGPARLVSGVLRAPAGAGVGGVPLFLVAVDHSWRRCTNTDRAGRFAFAGMAGRQILSVPPCRGFRAETRSFELTADSVKLDLWLRERATTRLAGRVMEADGCPISEGVMATVAAEGGAARPFEVDERGYFDMSAAPSGRVVIRTTSPLRTELRQVNLTRTGADRLNLKLDLGRRIYRGRVESNEGVPIVGVTVHLERKFVASPNVQARSFRTAHTDAGGFYEFHDLGPDRGEGQVMFVASGFTTTLAAVPPVGDGSLHIVHMNRVPTNERRNTP